MGHSVKPDLIPHITRGKLIPVEGLNINIKQQHVTPHSAHWKEKSNTAVCS